MDDQNKWMIKINGIENKLSLNTEAENKVINYKLHTTYLSHPNFR